MAIPYKIYKNNNSKSPAYGLYYARANHIGTKNTLDLAKDVEKQCTATEADVLAVINALVFEMKRALQEGYKVKLDEFGTFKINIQSVGCENVDEFSVTKNIVGAKTRFLESWHTNVADQTRDKKFTSGVKFREV